LHCTAKMATRALLAASLLTPAVVAFDAGVVYRRGAHRLMAVEGEKVETMPSEKGSVGVDIWGNPVSEEELADLTAPRPAEAEKRYTRSDLAGSEWKVGINWRDSDKIDVSWFRLKADGASEWGFFIGGQGRWKMDDGLFVTVSQDYFLGWNGKRLFSAKIGNDPNYLEGVIRGWKPWEPAAVMGRWQAIRLGVERPNPPPWHDLEERVKLEEEEAAKLAASQSDDSSRDDQAHD